MADSIEIRWNPGGLTIQNMGSYKFVDVTDGDTPNIRMPIRMLSIDTPEVTAKSSKGSRKVDEKFKELAEWIKDGTAPVTDKFAEYILPRLETGQAGTLQFEQGQAASTYFKKQLNDRLKKPNNRRRRIFVRTTEMPFDRYHRLLAYVAPLYTPEELKSMSRQERATFNLALVGSGWAAPFVIFPNIPGEHDLSMFVEHAGEARKNKLGQYGDPFSLPAFEYRMCEKLYTITAKIATGKSLSEFQRLEWRERYAADMRNRRLYGPRRLYVCSSGVPHLDLARGCATRNQRA